MAEPAAKPVTTPELLIVAIDNAVLDQAPPEVASVNVLVAPTQRVVVPEIAGGAAGGALTITVVVVKQLAVNV